VNDLPAIAIEPTAENDLIVVFDALLSTRDAALIVTRPRVFLETYRAELGLLRDMLFAERDAPPEAPAEGNAPGASSADDAVLGGSILR
jgi:hypothetical protein